MSDLPNESSLSPASSTSNSNSSDIDDKTGSGAAAGEIGVHESRKINALITLLPVLITGVTFLLSFGASLWQWHERSQAQKDSEWRTALKQVSSKDNEIATQGAYEMQSFLDDGTRGPAATAIAAALLPHIKDHIAFDLIFFDLLDRTNQADQGRFIAIDSELTRQLYDAYWKAKKHLGSLKTPPADDSFGSFLIHPDLFFDEDTQSDDLAFVLDKAWELDSVSNGLSRLWAGQLKHARANPDGQGLDDLIFFNNDFSRVDFSQAGHMTKVQFVGNCKVNSAMLPRAGITIDCMASQ